MNQMMFKTLFFFLWGVLAVAGRAEDKNPRVLMIVDSIHRSTASAAAIALKAKAELVIPQIDPGSTGEVIGRLDQLLGKEKWDLIHFNFGFADLCHVDPKTKSRRVLSRHGGGKRMTSPEAYEENLRKIVARLKASGAKLVWASTTPLIGTKGDSLYEPGSEVIYNAIAARVMKGAGIPINDMHAWVLKNLPKHKEPFLFRKVPIQEPMVGSITRVLKLD